MKNIFNILLLFLCFYNISYSQDKSNVECGFFGTKTVEERNSIFPFSEAKKVLLISYPNESVYGLRKIDSLSLSQYGYKIEREFIFHNNSFGSNLFDATKVTSIKEVDKNILSNLMFNYDYKLISNDSLLNRSFETCYTPRNAILFLDKNEKVISVIEICFQCYNYYLFPKSEEFKNVLGLECDERLSHFKNLFENYGFEILQNNSRYIFFEIKDKLEVIKGATIIINESEVVKTDFSGIAPALLNNKTKKVELSYMGKPTFVKIIKNCDFIKVDLSKGRVLYYKDNKFIKSKKLIIQ